MYTYLIGWTKENKWYYGSRVANKKCPELDLWKHYFTSSKRVKKFRREYGEPDHIEIRKIFSSDESCRKWEETVLRRMKVVLKENWMNLNDIHAPPSLSGTDNGFFGKTHTNEKKEYWSRIRTGRKASPETRRKMSGRTAWNKGIPWSEEAKKKMSESALKIKNRKRGHKLSEEHKQKLRKPKSRVAPFTDERRKKISVAARGKKWYHDKNTLKCVKCIPGTEPDGFIPGMIKKTNGLLGRKLSEEHKQKMRNTIRKKKEFDHEHSKSCES